MPRHAGKTVVATLIALIAGVVVALAPGGVASAEPADGLFTDQIDDYADYDGADSCSAGDKPGAVALMTAILAAYPGTSAYISRACAGGTSEHEEGRAIDWMVSAETQGHLAEDLASLRRQLRQQVRHGPPARGHVHHLRPPSLSVVRRRGRLAAPTAARTPTPTTCTSA